MQPPSCPNLTQQPSLHLTGLDKCQKGDFTSSTIAFYPKSIFDYLNPFTNILGYFNLWDIFRFIFRQHRITFFS